MNLRNLSILVPERITYMSEHPEIHSPLIRIWDSKQNTEVIFPHLFEKVECIFTDFKTLAIIWDGLLPDEDCSIDMKHHEILQWIGGKLHSIDILVIIEWLRSECDIDNGILMNEIQKRDK